MNQFGNLFNFDCNGLHCCVGFSLVAASRGAMWLWCAGCSLQWFPLLQSTRPRMRSLQLLQLLAHRLNSCGYTGSAALWHAESSQTRDQTCVFCIGRQLLNHWTTREAQKSLFFHGGGDCDQLAEKMRTSGY